MKFSYPLLKKLLPSIPQKTKLAELLNMYVFELESVTGNTIDIKLPANRWSDAASHIGIAREIAAAKGLKFKLPIKDGGKVPKGKGLIKVRVENKAACPRYAARVFEIPGVGTSSKEMQTLLADCGIKTNSDIVDIMNYVMLETGQPLHAFDLDTLAERTLVVRNAKRGEQIETLDHQKFALDPDVLVIADAERPQAIAGIKGGAASGVSAKTKRIVVEAANFEQGSVMRTSRRLKLATDAAARFSHGMSPVLVDWGMARATELLVAAGAKLVDSVDISSAKPASQMIEFDCARYESLIGVPTTPASARGYFERLGFSVAPAKKSGALMVTIPAWRMDIENMEGLIEEAARLFGFNKIPARPPVFGILPPHVDDSIVLKGKLRTLLAKYGVSEVYNTSFVGPAEADNGAGFIALENPVAEDRAYFRRSLLPLLERNIRDNARYFETIRVFEIGNVLADERGKTAERTVLGIALAVKKEPRIALELKGLVAELLRGVGVDDAEFTERDGEVAVEADGTPLGTIVYRDLEKQWSVALAELDLGKVLGVTEEEKEYVPLKRFPAVIRDISMFVRGDARIGEIVEAIQGKDFALVENVDLIDEYRDEKMGGRQSLTLRIIFQADDRTLTDAEVNKEMEKMTRVLQTEFQAEVR